MRETKTFIYTLVGPDNDEKTLIAKAIWENVNL